MASKKGVRIVITLECTECRSNTDKRSPGVSRYTTMKNRRNTTGRMELKKFCTHCNAHYDSQRNQNRNSVIHIRSRKNHGILS